MRVRSWPSTEGYVAARNFVVRDEGNFLRYIASTTMDASYELEAATRADDVVLERNAGTAFQFEITGEPMLLSLAHDLGATPGNTFVRPASLPSIPTRVYSRDSRRGI